MTTSETMPTTTSASGDDRFVFVPLDLRTASDEQLRAVHDLFGVLRAESQPDDPPVLFEENLANWRNLPPIVQIHAVVAEHQGQTVGVSVGHSLDTPENRHMMDCEVIVHPNQRRQGLGRRLLRWVAETANANGRRLLMSSSSERVAAGEAFAKAFGAEKGLESHTNQLKFAELERDLLAAWLAAAPTERFELRFLDGTYPPELLAAMADLLNVVANDAPHDNLEIETIRFNAEQIEQMERHLAASGRQRWTVIAIERQSGDFAGYSEVSWHPNRPDTVSQGGTGVFPHFRGHGLGRWLKAAMIDKLIAERPIVDKIRTGNADSNAPMLKINHQLGFKPYISRSHWQMSVEDVLQKA
jgi:mycothiol synthase